jgi:hypothetical protein
VERVFDPSRKDPYRESGTGARAVKKGTGLAGCCEHSTMGNPVDIGSHAEAGEVLPDYAVIAVSGHQI